MHWPTRLVLWAALCIAPAFSLQASEAGVVDWHKPLVGVPLADWHSTAPAFHRPNKASDSVIVTATGSNVLAALNATDGSIAWRYTFAGPADQVAGFYKHDSVVAALSGPGGATLRLFDVLRGHLLLEQHLHAPEAGRLMERTMGTAVAFLPTTEQSDAFSDLAVLTNAHEVRRINAKTGDLVWAWQAEDQNSLVIYSKLIPTPDAIFVVGLAKSLNSLSLHITSLNPATGAVLASVPIPSSLADATTDLLALTKPDALPLLVWLEGSTITSLALLPELDAKPKKGRGAYARLVDLGLPEQGFFVAALADETARLFCVDKDGAGVRGFWEFPESAKRAVHSDSIYKGGIDAEGNPYIARVYWTNSFKLAMINVYGPNLSNGAGSPVGWGFPFKTDEHGRIGHIAFEATATSKNSIHARVLVTTSTGAVQLWNHEHLGWTREESLAYVTAAEFVDLPEQAVVASHAGEDESFAGRVARHLADAQNLPAYLRAFTTRFLTGSYARVSAAPAAPAAANGSALFRDQFGFRKLLLAVTPFGKLYALDSASGAPVWSRLLALGAEAEAAGAKLFPARLFVTRTSAEGRAEAVLVCQRRADTGLIDTVIYHVDALTGEDLLPDSKAGPLLDGFDAIPGGIVEAYLADAGEQRVVAMIDEYQQVHLYPTSPAIVEAFAQDAGKLRFALRTGKPGERKLMGHGVMSSADEHGKFLAYPAWTLALPAPQNVLAVVSAPREPVASLGKVLADRTTLYKYLNPRLSAVVSGAQGACELRLVDGAGGAVVYHRRVPARECDVKVALKENWLVYHFYEDGGAARGFLMVSVELYEGQGVDQKTGSAGMSGYSAEALNVHVYERAFVYAHDVSALAMTGTQFGITAKELVVANRNGQVQTLPRHLLDPRRPSRKPTAADAEEWLVQYDPVLPDDPRRVLSHNYHVADVKKLLTSPALLESTSLVFAYGLDLFATRVAPSKTFDVLSASFNKAQLVFTLGALALAIVVTKPMVARKRLRERWFS